MIRLIIREVNHFLAKFFDEVYELGYDDGLEERYIPRVQGGECPGYCRRLMKSMKSNEIVRDTPDEENDDDD